MGKETKNKEKEIWKAVIFPDTINPNEPYKVSSYGRIKSFKTKINGDTMSPPKKNVPFVVTVLKINGKTTNFPVKTLVATAFLLPESTDHKFVIIKNKDTKDLRPENLAWVTLEQRITHDLSGRRWSKKKPIIKIDVPSGEPLQLEDELWAPIIFPSHILKREVYHISNLGRLKSFKVKKKIGYIVKPLTTNHYHLLLNSS